MNDKPKIKIEYHEDKPNTNTYQVYLNADGSPMSMEEIRAFRSKGDAMTDLEKIIRETLENHLCQYAKDIYFKAPEPEKDVYVNEIIQAVAANYVLKADIIAGAELAAEKKAYNSLCYECDDPLKVNCRMSGKVNQDYCPIFRRERRIQKQIILDSIGIKGV